MATWTDNQRIDVWIQKVTGLTEFQLDGITAELAEAYNSDPFKISTALGHFCNQVFDGSALASSFTTPIVYILLETPPRNFFTALHQHLEHIACNLKNIHVIVPLSLGIDSWWAEYQRLELIDSYHIYSVIDFPFSQEYLNTWYTWFTRTPLVQHQAYWGRGEWYQGYGEFSLHMLKQSRANNIQKYFSYFGGTSSGSFESGAMKQYAVLKFKTFNGPATVEFLGRFWDRRDFLNYVDRICAWSNARELHNMLNSYNHEVNSNTYRLRYQDQVVPRYEDLTSWHPVWNQVQARLNESFACIVRESLIEQPYSAISEKTMSAFLSFNLVVPMEYCGVKRLEAQGFKFDHAIFDYSYQNLPSAQQRISCILDNMNDLAARYTLHELNEYYLENIGLYQHNANRALELLTSTDLTQY